MADPLTYYETVVGAVDVPVLGYHFPAAARPGIPVDLLPELPIAGLKDSTGDPERLALEADALPVGLYTGSASVLLQGRAMGCSGAILALANVDPVGCAQAWDGDGACQRELINGHRVGALAGIPGLKRTLAALRGTSPVTRAG